MCGILFELSPVDTTNPTRLTSEKLVRDVSRRGPDSLKTIEIAFNAFRLTFTASVLSLRGTNVVQQPLFSASSQNNNNNDNGGDDPEHLLCWNGEAWRFDGREFGPDENDTQYVFEQLTKCDASISDVLQKIEGPFAFVFYDGPRKKLWFGRDWLGRRSLLMRSGNDGPATVAICSIADPDDTAGWSEIEAGGFYYFDLHDDMQNAPGADAWRPVVERVAFVPQPEQDDHSSMKTPIPQLCKELPAPGTPALTPASPAVARLYDLLRDSLRLRVQNVPLHSVPRVPGHEGDLQPATIGVLFSGGLDCTMLARIAHDILPIHEPIELLNVAFENRRALGAAAAEAKKAQKSKKSKNSEVASSSKDDADPKFEDGIAVDNNANDMIYDICPDRQTGRKSWKELERTCAGRIWRFKEINIPYDEVLAHKAQVITLLHPHDTEMDLSIGLAFYFASRPTEPDSPRILLSGLGADELFGGYARHGTAFNRAGYPGLIDELELDLNRLGKRNLGRDDRIISNWGREARFPFLDERLLQETISWPVNVKCGFGNLDSGAEWDALDNEKKILRLLAWKLDMKGVAAEKKRAIQFGSRTAKMETAKGGKVKGTQKITIGSI